MGNRRNYTVLVLITGLISALLTPLTPTTQAQAPDWSWLSPDLDGDGLPNKVEVSGWCNAVGCFQTAPLNADSDSDGLTDGDEKLFDSDPTSDASPGIYVVYQDAFQTKEYYPWQQYGNKLIARGDDFDPPNPDSIDVLRRRGTDLDAVVVRRGTTFYVGGLLDATLKITKSKSALTSLSKTWDPYRGRWRVTVPSKGTVGKYTLKLGDKSLDLFAIFELPTPSGELTQLGIEKFLYDDDPSKDYDEMSILLGDGQFNYSYGFVAVGSSYTFKNQQYNRYLLEDYVIEAINGKTTQKAAADALTDKVDAETIFRNPRVLYDSWKVLHPGSDPRNQCSNIAGLLTAVNRAAGIPARPVMTDWRHSSFDHATEIWLNGSWRVFRGYNRLEIAAYPDETHLGCGGSQWPMCGSDKYYSRYSWGRRKYRPWHSGGSGSGNVIILANENWAFTGLAYRWPSWDVDTIKLNPYKFMTQNSEYWQYWGWTNEPTNTGLPGWPPPPNGGSANETNNSSSDGLEFNFQSSQVRLGQVVTEYSIDSNHNGQYDQLVLEIEVTATQPGSYWLLGQLSAKQSEPALTGTGGLVAQALTPIELVEGTQIVPMIFDGTEISLKRVDGAYLLSGLWITDVEAPGLVEFMTDSLAYRADGYTTAPYKATDFETYGAMLSDSYSSYDLDSNGDGHSDALIVTTGINLYQSGIFTVQASLYDGQDEFIAHTAWTGVGPDVTLRFENVAGTFGPYAVRELDLFNSEGKSIDYIAEAYTIDSVPELASPDLASLSASRVKGGTTAPDETLMSARILSESLVDGNLQIEAEVQVSDAGSFKLEAWLADPSGNLLTWGSGQPAILPAGTHILSLAFQGSNIRARGVNGPYTVVALKVLDGNAEYDVLDKVDIALTTQAYTIGQFATTDTVIALEDFVERDDGRWTADSAWTVKQGTFWSPTHAWFGTDANASLTLASPIDLSQVTQAALRFQTSHKLGADGDVGYVQASTDNTTWDTLAAFSTDAAWSTHILDLSDYDSESAVYLRFRLISAEGASNDGWYIDDVLIAGLQDSDSDRLSDDQETVYGTDPANADSDGDGLLDGDEVKIYNTDPTDADSDDDGTPDGWEVGNSLDPLDGGDAGADPDDDDLTNLQEYQNGTDPNDVDSDGDGLSDGDEIDTYDTDPLDPDSDDDGMSDGWEENKNLDPLDEADANIDPDNDGLTNLQEYQYNTNPADADSDDDGLADGDEVNAHHTNPADDDSDDDGLSDGNEVGTYDTDPLDADSDDDELLDGDEVNTYHTDPLDPDSDDDQLSDSDEVNTYGTDPTNADSDEDGLSDGDEISTYDTDPVDADSDDDGTPDGWEVENNLDPLDGGDADADPDGDDLTNLQEYQNGTDPNDADSDDDGLSDGDEIDTYDTDPLDPDSDDDGLVDGDEINIYDTDPLDPDSDDDGVPDGWEIENGSNPLNDTDADTDPDDDDLTNLEEFRHGTDPNDADSDDDELSDGDEVNIYGSNPTDADSDDDGLADGKEVNTFGSDPLDPDSDDDGLLDGDEVKIHNTDPLNPDSDDDGLLDGDEVSIYNSDPADPDSDGDGLSDGDEVYTYGTDPADSDSDDDGLADGDELDIHNTDPIDPDSDNDDLSDGDEVNVYRTDPNNPDSDGDGMSDGWEASNNLEPLDDTDANADPDNDGLTNLEEYLRGTNPHNSDTDGDGLSDGTDPHPTSGVAIFLSIVAR